MTEDERHERIAALSYAECIAHLATKHVLRTLFAFLDDPQREYIPPELCEKHYRRVLFVISGDHTLSPQVLHTFDCKGRGVDEVPAFESLNAWDMASLAIFIAACRGQVLVLTAKYKTVEEARSMVAHEVFV